MNNYLVKNDQLSFGYKGTWINAKGANAQLIAFGAFAMFIMIGIAALNRTSN
ncbi:MAG: hypothetical protein QM687_03920 [Ferruginibacter sp.]